MCALARLQVRGGCACKPRYHGAGCAFPSYRPDDPPPQPPPSQLPSATALRVYVYDLPPLVTGRRSWLGLGLGLGLGFGLGFGLGLGLGFGLGLGLG